MNEYTFPALEITLAYNDAPAATELLKKYDPHVYSVMNNSNTIFDVVSTEASLGIPEIARLLISHENPKQLEAEVLNIAQANNLALNTRIVYNEEELLDGNSPI